MRDDKLPVTPRMASAIASALLEFCVLDAVQRDAMTIAVGCTMIAALLRRLRKAAVAADALPVIPWRPLYDVYARFKFPETSLATLPSPDTESAVHALVPLMRGM